MPITDLVAPEAILPALKVSSKKQALQELAAKAASLTGQNWTTVCRGSEAKAREVFLRQVQLSSVGRFRLLDGDGRVVEERQAERLFSAN